MVFDENYYLSKIKYLIDWLNKSEYLIKVYLPVLNLINIFTISIKLLAHFTPLEFVVYGSLTIHFELVVHSIGLFVNSNNLNMASLLTRNGNLICSVSLKILDTLEI